MRHVRLTCLNHPNLRWQCKSIAVNSEGRYNGARNIFYLGTVEKANEDINAISKWMKESKPGHSIGPLIADVPECTCYADALRFAPEELERQKTEPLID